VLALFAVGGYVYAAFNLTADGLSYSAAHPVGECLMVVGLSCDFQLHHIQQVVGPGHTAAVGGENPVGAVLH